MHATTVFSGKTQKVSFNLVNYSNTKFLKINYFFNYLC